MGTFYVNRVIPFWQEPTVVIVNADNIRMAQQMINQRASGFANVTLDMIKEVQPGKLVFLNGPRGFRDDDEISW